MKSEQETQPGTEGEAKLNCSFCGKSQDEVRKLIAGPAVYICDACVDLCNDILESQAEGDEACEVPTIHPSRICPLCRLPKDVAELRMIADKGALCIECIEVILSASEAVDDDATT